MVLFALLSILMDDVIFQSLCDHMSRLSSLQSCNEVIIAERCFYILYATMEDIVLGENQHFMTCFDTAMIPIMVYVR